MKVLTVVCNLCLEKYPLDLKANDKHLRQYHKVKDGIKAVPEAYFTVEEVYDAYDLKKIIATRVKALKA